MKTTSKFLLALGLMLTGTLAVAHPGHDGVFNGSSFLSGLTHPFLGLDHLLAMAAIGFWSTRQSNILKNGTPLFVAAGMNIGAVIALSGIHLAGIETSIAMSVLLAGLLIATLAKLPTAIGGSLVALFMVAHGYAHGAEMATGANIITYMLGFLVATLAITISGRALGTIMQKSNNHITRTLGGIVAVIGGFMVAG